ncbi:insulin-like growth factor 1 receptor [Palaemon carinicauda]|uniref:insulin-like growth factor 1 receptor n=1 Tax=Palaemon carinicauda TaxID=392227 RepID=UPI0035B69F6F
MSTRATNLTIPGLQPFTRYLVKVVACHPPERSRVLCSTEPKTISFITPKISTGGSHKVTDLELKDGLTGRQRISWRPPLTLRGELVAYLVTLRLRLPANYRSSKSYSTVFCITDRDFKEKNNTFEIEETYLEPGLYTVGVEALTNPPSPSNDSHAYVDIAVKMEILPTVLQSPTVIAGVLSGCFVGSTILGVILRVVFKKAPKGNDLHLAVKEDTIRDDVSSSSTNQQLRLMFPESQILKGYLRVSRLLAKGTYGSVYLGEMRPPNAPASVPIAVKKSRSSYRKDEILNEAKLMLELDCHHLVKSYGIATKSSQVYLVMDLAQQDLLSFLRSLKPMDGNVFSSLDLQKVCAIAIQIADGMAYLAKHAIIHRDLAARNCLMFENLHVKISDFGMSRVTDNNCYYTKTTKYFPVRWLPPEYFKHNRFTCQSDVWSYGVVLWEILSKGALPYKDVRLGDVKAHVTNGNTLESEIVCQTPPFMSAMMTSCWNMDEKRRPYFPQIVRTLYPHISPSFRTHFGKVSFYDTEEGQEYKRQVDWLRDPTSNHPVHCDEDLGCDTQPPQLPARSSCKMKRFAFLPTLVLSDMIPKRFSLVTPDYENLLKTNVGEDPSKAPQETQSLLEIRNVVIDGESEAGSVAGIGSAHISSPHLKNRMTPPKSSCMMKWFASLPTLVFFDTMPKRYSLETPVSENVLKTTMSDDPSEVHQEAQSLLDTSNIVIDEESVTGSVAGIGSAHRVSSYLENRTTPSKSSFGICSSKLDLKSKFEKPYSSLESNEDTDDQVESTSVNLDLQRVRYSFTSTRNFPKCRPGKRSKSFSYHGVSSPNIKDGTS